jgi:hypothetical protein
VASAAAFLLVAPGETAHAGAGCPPEGREATGGPPRRLLTAAAAVEAVVVGPVEHGLGRQRAVLLLLCGDHPLQPRRQLERHGARHLLRGAAAVVAVISGSANGNRRGSRSGVPSVALALALLRRRRLGLPGRLLPAERHRDGRAARRRVRRAA